jgi:hypothetical protein
VLVVVVAMRGVPVAVVHIVDVVAVGHRDVSAPVTVGVAVGVVGGVRGRFALVEVPVVRAVQVAVVGVVDVVAMRHGDVPTALAMGVVVTGMFNVSSRHDALASWRSIGMSRRSEQPPL